MPRIELLTTETARQIAVHAAMLSGKPELVANKYGVMEIIEHLGYVQIDTIAVVERAHHHVLWSRLPDYQHQWLNELQSVDKKIFEYWGHGASFLPLTDYRFYLPRMHHYRVSHDGWQGRLLEKYAYLLPEILVRIRDEGPLGSKDFKRPKRNKREGWWDWKPAKIALELLFWQGYTMVIERRGFQRIYDLTERVLPENVDTTMPSAQETTYFFVRRALRTLGVASLREIELFMEGADRVRYRSALDSLCEEGEVVKLKIDEKQHEYFALKTTLDEVFIHTAKMPIYILSPFDPLVINRQRLKILFDFDYSLECYLPTEKRKFGYFALPILWHGKFIGRMDAQADRANKTLCVHTLKIKSDRDRQFQYIFNEHLLDYAKFNGCSMVVIEKATPQAFKMNLSA